MLSDDSDAASFAWNGHRVAIRRARAGRRVCFAEFAAPEALRGAGRPVEAGSCAYRCFRRLVLRDHRFRQ